MTVSAQPLAFQGEMEGVPAIPPGLHPAPNPEEWAAVHGPLALALAQRAGWNPQSPHPFTRRVPYMVALGGGVATGKSTLAAWWAALLNNLGVEARVVCTDSFLLPMAEMEKQGLAARKGFPESYDRQALHEFLQHMTQGLPAELPVYSHSRYDIVPGQRQQMTPPHVLLVEGVNVLGEAGDHGQPFDLAIYLEAPASLAEQWHRERFLALRVNPPPGSPYSRYGAMSEPEALGHQQRIWREINQVNLDQHIRPAGAKAHWVVEKSTGHRVVAVRQQQGNTLLHPERKP